METGANMPESAFDVHMKQQKRLVGENVVKAILYLSLLFSGVDGVNTEEIIRFLQVGRHLNVPEKDSNDLLLIISNIFHENYELHISVLFLSFCIVLNPN